MPCLGFKSKLRSTVNYYFVCYKTLLFYFEEGDVIYYVSGCSTVLTYVRVGNELLPLLSM